MTKARIELPPKLIPVFTDSRGETVRYRGAHGGRGSGKTRTFALMTAVKAYMFAESGRSGMILSAREYMNSLEDSSMEEIKQAIRSVDWLNDYFDIGEKYIRTKNRLVHYTFAGLSKNLDSIKSKARILIAWIDEAENVSETAWRKLRPTVRENGSEVWVTWNPELDGSPTDTRFRKNLPSNAKIVEINFTDNPWFPDVLEQERLDDREMLDDATYAWIWEGAYLENSDAQILSGKYRVAEFEPHPQRWNGPYFGIDWGFSQDPTAAVKCWVHDRCLYIEYEAGQALLSNDRIASLMIERIPGIADHVVRADSARPETINHVKDSDGGRRATLPRVEAVDKWPGSVEDGIAHLRSYREIIIHPRCVETIKEARQYSYKVDRLSGDVLTTIVDKFNHYIDACVEHGQLVATNRGLIPIQDVVAGDYVQTRIGSREVLVSRLTHESAPIYELRTASGKTLRATGDHRVYIAGIGYLRMDSIRYNDSVLSLEPDLCHRLNQSSIAVSCGIDIQSLRDAQTANTSSGRRLTGNLSTFIGRFGKIALGLYRMVGMFTTKMKIARTMTRKTLNVSPLPSTGRITAHGMVGIENILSTLRKSGLSQRRGTPLKRELSGIGSTASGLGRTVCHFVRCAISAAKRSTTQIEGTPTDSVRTNASLHGEERMVSIMSRESASSAEKSLRSINTERLGFVPDRVLSVRATGETNKVYDLMVDEAEEFFASGVLVHNCRYALTPLIKRNRKSGLVLSRHRG